MPTKLQRALKTQNKVVMGPQRIISRCWSPRSSQLSAVIFSCVAAWRAKCTRNILLVSLTSNKLGSVPKSSLPAWQVECKGTQMVTGDDLIMSLSKADCDTQFFIDLKSYSYLHTCFYSAPSFHWYLYNLKYRQEFMVQPAEGSNWGAAGFSIAHFQTGLAGCTWYNVFQCVTSTPPSAYKLLFSFK